MTGDLRNNRGTECQRHRQHNAGGWLNCNTERGQCLGLPHRRIHRPPQRTWCCRNRNAMEWGLSETGALLSAHFDEAETSPHKLSMSRWKNREGVQEHPTKHEDKTLNLPLRASNRGLSINGYVGPSAQCRAVCSMQGRLLNAGPCAQCRHRLLNAGPSAPCKAVCTTQRRMLNVRTVCASVDVEKTFLQGAIWPELSPTDRALLRSQCGPFAAIPFTCSPVVPESRLEPQILRVLLFRRLWCPLPLTVHSCR